MKIVIGQEIIDTPISLAPGRTKIVYEPLGVALVLGAWNFPICISIMSVVAAIAAGNCVILKPSEVAPNAMFALKKLFDEYMDDKYFVCLTGGP